MDIKSTFAKNLRHYRTEKNMTQEELAKLSQVAVNSIRSYEQAKANATIENIAQIAEALNVTISQLCDNEQTTQPIKINTYADLLCILMQLESLSLNGGRVTNGYYDLTGEVLIECNKESFETPDLEEVDTYSLQVKFIDKKLYDFFSTYQKMLGMIDSEHDNDGKETLIHMKDAWVENQIRKNKDYYIVIPF